MTFNTSCVHAAFSTRRGWYCEKATVLLPVSGKVSRPAECSPACYQPSPIRGPADPDDHQITTQPF